MSMKITGNYVNENYVNHAANPSGTAQKSGVSSGAGNGMSNSEAKVQAYYEQLCRKFPDITFNVSAGLISGNENHVVVNLSRDCLEKMASDPEFAKDVEMNLSGVVPAQKGTYARAKSDGAVLHGVTTVLDADGNFSVTCGGMSRTGGTKQNVSKQNIENKQKERLEKKRRERKAMEEKASERRAEKRMEQRRAAERRVEKKMAEEVRFDAKA